MRLARVVSLLIILSLFHPAVSFGQWVLDGAPVSTAPADQQYPQAISDGAGGVIVTWQDYRNVATDIYVQRVDAAGVAQWTANVTVH